MSYVVLARKYRPMRFADMVGQEHIGRTLGNAIKQDRVHHAYLFSGARGLGKTTTARIFAKGLVCVNGPTAEPCNACSECVAVSEGRSVDVLEIDGASNNSVDDIRNLREQVSYLPQTARRKVYIIDEVHMLSTSAFNALLKTLEEPPPHVNFVFATTEPQKVLPTILSRVNRLDFKRVAPAELVAYLQQILKNEGMGVDAGGLRIVARAGEGSVRDALTLLDQVIAFAEDPRHVSEDEVRRLLGQADAGALHGLVEAILDGDPTATMQRFDALVTAGNDLSVLGLQVLELLRDLTVLRVCGTPEVLPDATEAELAQLRALGGKADPSHLGQLFDRFSRVIDRLPQSRSQRLLVEMGLLELACAEPVMPLGDLVEQLHALGRGAPPPAAGGRGGGSTPRAAGGGARGRSTASAGGGWRAESRDDGPGFVPPEMPSFERSTAPARGRSVDEGPGFVPPEMPSFERSASPARGRPVDDGPGFVPPEMPSFERTTARAPRIEPPIYDDPPPPTHGLPPEPPPYDEPPPGVRASMPEPPPFEEPPPRRPAPSLSVVPPPPPAPEPAASPFMAKLLDMGLQSGMVASEPGERRPPSSQPAIVPTSTPPAPERRREPEAPPSPALRPVADLRPVEPAPPTAAQARPEAPAPDRAAESSIPEIRMGVGPCLPPPPADGVIPWESLEPFEAWEQLVARIREVDDIVGAMLDQVGLVALTAGVLKIAAPRGSLVHTQLSRAPELRATIDQATRDHFGAPFALELVEDKPELPRLPSIELVVKDRRARHRARVEAEAKAHPGIQTLLRLFDAQLVGTRPLQEP